jgi:PAS domain S-box-containing protein
VAGNRVKNKNLTGRPSFRKALRGSEEKFRLLFEKSMDPMFLLDGDVFIDCNEAALRLLQCSTKDQVVGLHPFDMSPDRQPDDRPSSEKALALIESTFETGVNRFEWLHRDFRGRDLWVEVSLTVVPIQGREIIYTVWRDISDRKKGEALLRESEERYRTAIEHSNDGVSIIKGDTHVYVNKKFLEMFGYDRFEEVVEKRLAVFVHPDDQAMVREYGRKRQTGEEAPSRYEFKGVKGDGTTMFGEASVTRIVYRGEPASLAYFRDITERKSAEEALRESETKLRAIFDGSRDAIGVSKGGIHTYVNPAHLSLFGYESNDDLIGTPIIDLIAPGSRGLVEERIKKRAAGKPVPSLYEVTALKKDGTTFPMECSVSTYLLRGEKFTLAIFRDVTERKRREEEIGMLKHSIDVHYDAVYWLDSDNRCVYVNEAACSALGYECEELIGKTIFDIAPQPTEEDMRGIWQKLREEGSYLRETVHRRKDGSEFPIDLLVTYIQFDGREFACAFARDISEKKRLEEQLRQSHKMEAIGTLAGGIAHDFNNMLAVIMGNAELALDDAREEGIRMSLGQILKASKRSRDLVKQILTFSRGNGAQGKAVKMAPLLRETFELLRASFPSTIRMNLNIRTKSDTVLADPSQIQQVVVNLANNAAHAMRDAGGILTISLSSITLGSDSRKVEDMRSGPYVKLTVRDTGTGISPEVERRMFEPFFTTKEPGQGTGMGLSVVYGIVKGCNGLIEVESEAGQGSTFTVLLPQSDVVSTPEQKGEATPSLGRARILFVDDEPTIAALGKTMLEHMGCIATAVTDSRDALKVFSENPDGFDLIITDQTMPDMTGIVLAKEALAIRRDMPIILCTGYSETVSPAKACEAGIRGFVMKPITKEEMVQVIRKVLERGQDIK